MPILNSGKRWRKHFVLQFVHEDFLGNFPLFSRFTLGPIPPFLFSLPRSVTVRETRFRLCLGTKWRTNGILLPGVGITRVCLKKSGPHFQKLCGVGEKRTADKGKRAKCWSSGCYLRISMNNSFLLFIGRNETLLGRIDLQSIILSHSGRQIPHDFTYIWSLKNKINKRTK